MRNIFVMLLVGLLGFGLGIDHAEAKRLGGGKSFGSYSRSADSSASTAGRNTATTSQRQPGAGLSRWAGPFAGLLAGGLLASLFFGGAFDGLRFFDILLVALVAWLAFRFLRARRAATASGPQQNERQSHTQQDTPPFSNAGSTATGSVGSTPEWFDKERFLGGAKEHFMTLQRAWDNNDLAQVQEYVTPALYNLLREERAQQPANNRTEIIRLFAELGDIREIGQQAEASVLFHGILDENDEQTEFNETWHLIRDLRDGAPWYVQGIEQNPSV
ncbi:Tim44 domain-containing protein [Chromohalobacter nigrandesensis]|uniref:Tim44 domain-containing protein n=1 Tax=Chromohalobacter nigrandesensis TaxID=119863 RepID=UPI001FF6F53D|nr:TIM44-like domain-containing protein [Chromohalobacter nigrandesensis]MCK0745598.1 Tim44-like domain-containing protein [Chromohalobacter nigrandesensis]